MGDINEIISVDAAPGIAGLKEFTAALEAAADKWAAFEDKLKSGLGGGGADKLAASMDAAAASISAAADKAAESLGKIGAAADPAVAGIGRMGDAADAAAGGLRDASAGADEMAAASDRVAESADAAAVSLDRQAASADKSGASAAEAGAAGEGAWGAAKVALLGLGVAAAYGIDKAMKFQSQMLLLNTQAGVSMPNVKKMSQGVLEVSTTTGQSLSNVAESAYHVASNMASMGSTVPNMLNAVKTAAEGASVGHANMVDVTNALTAAIASGIPGVKNYSQAMGVLNATVGSGDMSMQDLADAFGTGMVASVKGYGLSIKDVGAALATFGDNNIRGAKAGTDLRMAVQALAVPVSTAAPELKKLGLTTNSLAKDMQSGGLLKALDDLQSKFTKNGITAKNEGQVITDLFGKKAGVGLSLLMEQMDRVKSKYPALTKGANDFNAAWKATQKSPAQEWKELVTGLQNSATNFGEALLPAFTKAAGFADKILDDISSSKGAATALVGAFGGLAALFAGNKLASGIKEAFSTGESVLRGIGKVSQVLNIPGLSKLANIGGGATGAAALDASAANLDGAAEALSGAAAKLSGEGSLPGGAARGAEGAGEDAAGAAGVAEGAGAASAGAVFGAAAAVAIGAAAGLALGIYLNKYENQDHPPPAGQQGPRAPNSAAAGNQAWKQYDQITPTLDLSQLNAAKAKVTADMAQLNQDISAGKAAKLPAPDLSALDQAKVKAQASMDQINQAINQAKAAKIPSPDMSALATAKTKAAQGAADIHTAAQTPLDKPVKAASPDLSAFAAAKAKAAADGAAVDNGLASGIMGNAGAAVAAAQNVANQVSAIMAKALESHSPSKVTERIGKSAVDGLVVGLEGGQAAVTAAAQALGKATAKAADVTAIDTAIGKGITDAGKDSALVTFLKTDQTKLLSLAAQRTALEQEITDSTQIAQQAISNASIMNAGAYTPASAAGPQSSAGTIQGMQSMLADQQAFAQQVGQLKKMGLNATNLNQIVQSGASAGLPIAQGLTSGGKSAIQQINQLESQLQSSAGKLGDEGAGPMYQAGVDAGKGLAQGIKSELGTVDAAIKSLADSMVAAAKSALKSHSPSLVFRDIGFGIPQGAAMGVDAGSGIAAAAVGRMGSRMAGAFHPAYAGGGGHGGGSGGGNTIIQVTVQGSVTTEQDLLTKLQGLQLKKASNNWQGGFKLPGRAT